MLVLRARSYDRDLSSKFQRPGLSRQFCKFGSAGLIWRRKLSPTPGVGNKVSRLNRSAPGRLHVNIKPFDSADPQVQRLRRRAREGFSNMHHLMGFVPPDQSATRFAREALRLLGLPRADEGEVVGGMSKKAMLPRGAPSVPVRNGGGVPVIDSRVATTESEATRHRRLAVATRNRIAQIGSMLPKPRTTPAPCLFPPRP